MRKIILAFHLLLVFAVRVEAETEYVTLSSLIADLGGRLEWNPIRMVGVICMTEDCLVFKVGAPWVLYNYREKIPTGVVVAKEGQILFPAAAARRIIERREMPKNEWGLTVDVILIDPGHGGRDSGAIGVYTEEGAPRTLQEKDVVLKVGLLLRDMLQSRYPRKEVLLTRDGDTYPTLEDRVAIAHKAPLEENQAIVFISLHANYSFNPRATGFEVWYLPPDYRRAVEDEESVGVDNVEIMPILNTIREEDITIESVTLAQAILDGLEDAVGSETENRGMKEETWFVVRKAKMPSVLVEVGFLTNDEEITRLADDAYLMRIAEGIYNGLCSFLGRFDSGE